MSRASTDQRLHILRAKLAAILNVREVLEIFLMSEDPDEALVNLQNARLPIPSSFFWLYGHPSPENPETVKPALYRLDAEQARSVLGMRLARLTYSERIKAFTQLQELAWDLTRRNGGTINDETPVRRPVRFEDARESRKILQ